MLFLRVYYNYQFYYFYIFIVVGSQQQLNMIESYIVACMYISHTKIYIYVCELCTIFDKLVTVCC